MPIASPTLDGFIYDTAQYPIVIGATHWKIEALKDFEATVDELFAALNTKGKPEWLEDLCPYFAKIWPSALALSRFIQSDQRFTASQNQTPQSILELGCGLALPSMIIAKMGHNVTASDYHPDVPLFLKKNLEINRMQNTVHFETLSWQKSHQKIGIFDWVIGSDILYDRIHPEALCDALFYQLSAKTKVLIADPARPYLQPFIDAVTRRTGVPPKVFLAAEKTPTEKEVFIVEFET